MAIIERSAALLALAIGLAVAATSETVITEHPSDVLVTEGDEAILKCKTSGEATRCKWLLNRTDNPYELVDVKEFYPKRDGDCSIRIKQVRPVHVGRWVCSVHISLLQEQLVSRPAAVAIATLSARASQPTIVARPANTSVPPGGTTELACRTNTEVASCGWALPGDVVISLSQKTLSLLDDLPLSFTGDLASGDCSVRVDTMSERFAGEWSCFFNIGDNTIWTSPAHLELVSAQAQTGGIQAAVSPAVLAVLVIAVIALASVISAAIWFRRRRAQLRHDKLLENPLYGIRNLQLAAAATAAQHQAKEDNRLNTMTALSAAPSARALHELGLAQRALPNDYSGKNGGASTDKERVYAHVYDTPRKSNLYDVPSSREAYSVPRSSYEIPPTPVRVDFHGGGEEGNVYEEVRSTKYKDEDMDGYLVPSEKMKM
ncbi:uncharacterized protein LOC122385975 [Amphibalanus amphitrite]|uniref:uncharacterized protein LOC122385975 n=1 Tax=Amphibalanus amphitrite TaxID=1232801 RepID=UPI001C927E81|nr:uncharacterized protein LOC122385975 [Amphibalanus amphitrite]